jgi:hypothetical protein
MPDLPMKPFTDKSDGEKGPKAEDDEVRKKAEAKSHRHTSITVLAGDRKR